MFDDIWGSIESAASSTFESVSEGASNWVDGWINKEVSEVNAQPETNDEKAKQVTFGDGKEAPTVTTNAPGNTGQFINGVDNQTLLLVVVGGIALFAVAKG